ncbi:hypothetical protein [Kitasatospora viridis]|uniref:Htaa protein n=1 Tax=Kitasatospora viridis TaxID=281105 RepID=A0A561UH22_9ACTN|nr:hypothetical protein [Kitasatospora viridis]TWF98669.1 hypothetical protein FHX73_112490 [Kitasatospora viridis]
MTRMTVRLVATAAVAASVAMVGLSDTATAATTPASGSLVVQEDNTFLQNSLQNGIIAVALPSATVGYNPSTGFSGTFPVTGGSVNVSRFYGAAQLGGQILVVNLGTGQTVIFNNLAFDASKWAVTAVPQGSTTAVKLFDPKSTVITKSGTTQNLAAGELDIDAAAAQYADNALGTSYFTAGQNVGSANFSFTPAS